jgi:Spy/CpxP family protein refolding chaperone
MSAVTRAFSGPSNSYNGVLCQSRFMKSKKAICFAVGLTLAGAALTLTAQETNAPINPPVQNRPQPQRPVRPLEGFAPLFNVLTDEQRASMEQVLQGQREKLREMEMKIRAGLNGKFDEEAVRKHASALAGFEAEMTVLRVKALSQIQPPLTPEQIERIKNMPMGVAPGAGRPLERPGRQRILQNQNRDENNLPPKN